MHEMMLVEGVGGILTPILKDYFVTNLIKDMKYENTDISGNSKLVGTVNHTNDCKEICEKYKIPIKKNNYK